MKKLLLSRESLRHLTEGESDRVVAGYVTGRPGPDCPSVGCLTPACPNTYACPYTQAGCPPPASVQCASQAPAHCVSGALGRCPGQ